jgi:hypothetical protein
VVIQSSLASLESPNGSSEIRNSILLGSKIYKINMDNALLTDSGPEPNEFLYQWTSGEIIAQRYRAETLLGDGTFGRVLEVTEIATGKIRALKIVMPHDRYVEEAKAEAGILKRIMNAGDACTQHFV